MANKYDSIVKRIRDKKSLDEKKSYTFRLTKDLMDRLESQCEGLKKSDGITKTEIIEALIEDFLKK